MILENTPYEEERFKLKYDYMNAMVEGKNSKIKVIKRVSYGYRSFRNFKARIMLVERYKNRVGRNFFLPLTPRSVPFGTPRFNSNNNLSN